jgi:hypothetical protein
MGIIGNTLNIIIFGRSRLRTNVSSRYSICLSLTQIGILFSNCLFRIISYGWSYGYDIDATVSAVCKSRAYVTILFIVLSRHFLCLITIDRWMKTSRSAWLRQKSSPKYAKWFIILSFIFWTVFSIHAPIGLQSASHNCTVPAGDTYALFYAIYSIAVGIIPFLIMIIFCFLIQKTIRTRRRNVIQVVRLSLLQSFFYLILNSVLAGLPVYNFITSTWVKSIEQRAIDSLLNDIGYYLIHTYISVSSSLFFYLYFSNCFF